MDSPKSTFENYWSWNYNSRWKFWITMMIKMKMDLPIKMKRKTCLLALLANEMQLKSFLIRWIAWWRALMLKVMCCEEKVTAHSTRLQMFIWSQWQLFLLSVAVAMYSTLDYILVSQWSGGVIKCLLGLLHSPSYLWTNLIQGKYQNMVLDLRNLSKSQIIQFWVWTDFIS